MKLCAMTVSPSVFQVLCSYETIHACWDGRRAENVGTSALGLRTLLFRNGIVVGVDGAFGVVADMVSFTVVIVVVLL